MAETYSAKLKFSHHSTFECDNGHALTVNVEQKVNDNYVSCVVRHVDENGCYVSHVDLSNSRNEPEASTSEILNILDCFANFAGLHLTYNAQLDADAMACHFAVIANKCY